MKISVLGLGWFGLPLARKLLEQGHEVQGSARSPRTCPGLKFFPLTSPEPPAKELLDCDILVLNIPPFQGQLEWFKQWSWARKPWLIFISSTSQKPLLLEEEKWGQEIFTDWTILRFGGLYGEERHPGKHLSGRENLPGRLWPVNLLHLEDAVGFTQVVIEKKLKREIFEVVGNEHPNREDFYTSYCRKMGIPEPRFDQNDRSSKEAISNEKAKLHYQFRH